MEDNKMFSLLITLTVGVIIVGALLAPTVAGVAKIMGSEVTIDNVGLKDDTPTYTVWNGEDLVLAYDNSVPAYTINGVSDSVYVADTQRIIIASNDFATRNGGTSDSPQMQSMYVTLTSEVINKSFTFTVSDGEYSLTLDGTTYTGTVDWLVYADSNGTANLGQVAQGVTFLTSDVNDVIVLGNIYTTGDNDTFYSYYDGQLTVNSTYEDSSSVSFSKTLYDGYTDIYSTTVSVTVDDETFTPYFVLVPLTVDGHEESAGSGVLLAVPVVVIAALLFILVPYISKREE